MQAEVRRFKSHRFHFLLNSHKTFMYKKGTKCNLMFIGETDMSDKTKKLEERCEGIVLVPFEEELEFIPFQDVLTYEEQQELNDYYNK